MTTAGTFLFGAILFMLENKNYISISGNQWIMAGFLCPIIAFIVSLLIDKLCN